MPRLARHGLHTKESSLLWEEQEGKSAFERIKVQQHVARSQNSIAALGNGYHVGPCKANDCQLTSKVICVLLGSTNELIVQAPHSLLED
jgi:hypothetical protein